LDIDIDSFDCSNLGENEVELTVTDPENELSDTCTATITVKDKIAPVITNCHDPVTATYDPATGYEIPDFTNQLVATDNCTPSGDLIITQNPQEGDIINSSQTITFRVEDASGNFTTCDFQLNLTEEAEPGFDCPDEAGIQPIKLGENCNYEVAEYDIENPENFVNEVFIDQSFEENSTGTGIFVTLEVYDGQGGDLIGECNFEVSLIDRTDPEIICPSDFSVPAEPGENFAVVNFRTPNGSDNCAIQSVDQIVGMPSGSRFEVGTHQITFEATDVNDNKSTCTFEFEVLPPNFPPSIQCPDNVTTTNDSGECGAMVTFPAPTTEDQENDELSISRTDDTGLQSGDIFPVGTTTISYEVTDGVNDPKTCNFTITVTDVEAPSISCPSSINESVPSGETGKIVTYEAPVFDDNCENAAISQTAGLPSGAEFPLGTTINTFAVDDGNGNIETCSFNVSIIEEGEDISPVFDGCPSDIVQNNDAGICGAVVTFNPPTATDENGEVPVERIDNSGLESGDVFPVGETTITFQAGDGVNDPVTCSFKINISDLEAPILSNCPVSRTETFNSQAGYEIPDFTEEITVSDNCTPSSELEVEQTPLPETVYTAEGEISVELKVTDTNGNSAVCAFTINLVLEGNNQSPVAGDNTYSTPENTTLNVDAPGVLGNDSDPDGDALIAIVEQQPSNGTLTLNRDGSFIYIPDPDFEGQDTFTYYATDGEGEGVATVTINVIGEPQGNVPPVALDDEYETLQDEELIVQAPGILANDSDPDNKPLFAVIIVSTENGEIELNEDGSFTYIPNPGFVGSDNFQYVATNNETGNSEIATVFIEVIPDNTSNFMCLDRITLELDENGQAALPIEMLYAGNAEGIEFGATERLFTCDDLGENVVTLIYNGRVQGSCDIIVEVIDNTPPVLQLNDVSRDLNGDGIASINFVDIDNGSFDTCDPDVTYTLSKSNFSCKDVGVNEVQVTAVDASGNSSTATINITVTANDTICETPPKEGSEYIFIYPNPNTGSFRVATPSDVTIQRLEVFDHRGRFIAAKDYSDTVTEYAMDLAPLQEAVYVLKMDTNEGVVTKRFIIKY